MADTWVKFEGALKAFADSAETQALFDNVIRLSTFQLVGGLVSAGAYDLGAAESAGALPMGDIATGYFLFLESDNNLTFALNATTAGGSQALDLKVRVTSQNATLVWMSEFTKVYLYGGGSNARVNYCMVGIGA